MKNYIAISYCVADLRCNASEESNSADEALRSAEVLLERFPNSRVLIWDGEKVIREIF